MTIPITGRYRESGGPKRVLVRPVQGVCSRERMCPPRNFRIEIYDSTLALSDRAALMIVNLAATGRGTVLTPGCNTPIEMYKHLGAIADVRGVDLISLLKGDTGDFHLGMIDGVEWPRTHPLSFPYYLAQHFLRYNGLPSLCHAAGEEQRCFILDYAYRTFRNIHVPWIPPDVPEHEKMAYAHRFSHWVASRSPIDLIIMGIGPDGHIAFLGPENHQIMLHAGRVPLWEEIRRWKWESGEPENCLCAREGGGSCSTLPPSPSHALTISLWPILSSRHKVVMAMGWEKAPAIKELVEGELHPDKFVAQALRDAQGEVTLLLDEEAASELSD